MVITIPITIIRFAIIRGHAPIGMAVIGRNTAVTVVRWWIGVQATVPPIPHGMGVNGTTIAAIVDSSWIMEPATAIPTAHGNITVPVSTDGLELVLGAAQQPIPTAITAQQRSTLLTVLRSISTAHIALPAALIQEARRNPIIVSPMEAGQITTAHSTGEQKAVPPAVTANMSMRLTVFLTACGQTILLLNIVEV